MSKHCTPLWHEARFQIKMHKTPLASDDFSKLGCRNSAHRCGAKCVSKSKCTKHTMVGQLLERCRNMVLVARGKFPSQNAQNTPGPDYFSFFFAGCCVAGPDYFSKLGCRKIARHCGRKCVSKSKCTKHLRFGALLEVSTSHVRSSFSQLVSQSIIVNPSVCQLVTQRLLN